MPSKRAFASDAPREAASAAETRAAHTPPMQKTRPEERAFRCVYIGMVQQVRQNHVASWAWRTPRQGSVISRVRNTMRQTALFRVLGVLRFVAFLRTHRRFHRADKRRRHRHRNNAQNNDLKVVLYKRNAAKKVAHEHEQRNPRNAANGVEQGELAEIHVARARDERRKRAEERHESRNDDGKAAVFREKVVEFGHALGRERLDFAGIDDARTEEAGDPVVRRVAQNGSHAEHDKRGPNIQAATVGGKHARREQERITRQKREEHQARFDEHDKEQRRIHPHRTKRDNPARNGSARVGKQVQEELNDVHD